MELHITAITAAGLRDQNEDRVLIGKEMLREGRKELSVLLDGETCYVIALADGMGGHNAGEVAAELVLNLLSNEIDSLPSGLLESGLSEEIRKWAQNAHRRLLAESERNPEWAGMGTTLVAVLFYGGLAYYFSAGDSRLYRFRDGYVVQLSQDHSVKAVTGTPSHALLNSFGGGKTVFVDFARVKLLEGDVLLLCSDGLTDVVTDDEIELILDTAQDPAAALVTTALERAGRDNITVVIIYTGTKTNTLKKSEMEE